MKTDYKNSNKMNKDHKDVLIAVTIVMLFVIISIAAYQFFDDSPKNNGRKLAHKLCGLLKDAQNANPEEKERIMMEYLYCQELLEELGNKYKGAELYDFQITFANESQKCFSEVQSSPIVKVEENKKKIITETNYSGYKIVHKGYTPISGEPTTETFYKDFKISINEKKRKIIITSDYEPMMGNTFRIDEIKTVDGVRTYIGCFKNTDDVHYNEMRGGADVWIEGNIFYVSTGLEKTSYILN